MKKIYGILIVSLLFLASCSANLQEGISEREANEIISILAKSGIPANKVKDPAGKAPNNWTLTVDSQHVPKAIKILHSNNLPAKKVQGLAEIYGGGGMSIPTDTEEKAKYQLALAGELIKTFKRIDGIVDARVHLVIPKQKILQRPGEKEPVPTASVLLIRQANKAVLISKEDVKKIVAASLESLEPQNVKVVFITQSMMAMDTKADGTDEVQSVMGIRVAQSDSMKFRILLISMILLVILFLSLFIGSFMKASSLKNQLRG